MRGITYRLMIVAAAILAPFASLALVAPGVANAIECGWGTVYDPPSDSCVGVPPPPPPPAWNGDPTPYFSVGICAPIPFVSLCTGI
jgi:hypothetical protein